MSEWVTNSGTLHNLHEWHRLEIWISLFFLLLNGLLLKKKWSAPFLDSYRFKGKSESQGIRMKEFKPSNLRLTSIKENTGENERLKSFFLYR